uniref:Uncharacterized protein n=1 Tax=Amphimedon queenslandica TaxID=400682 RepID=A0A1X7VN01_AMPQE
MAEIVLEGHTYSIAELPDATSPLVLQEQRRLLGVINLEALVDDLGRVGNCVRIAYHGVTGFVDLQIEIQRIGYDVTRLCDKSAVTVGKFKNASTTVLGSLKATYEFLMENFEDMAIDTLADVAETAKGMATAAEELRADFDNQAKKVVEALEKTEKTQDTEEKRKKKMEEDRKDMEAEKEKQEKLEKEAAEAQRKAEAMAQAADNKENDAIQAIMNIKEEERHRSENTGFWKKLSNAFTGRDTRAAAAVDASLRTQEDKAKAAREEKMRHLTLMQQKEDMRSKALAELAAYVKRIQNMKAGENEIEAVIDALQNAIRALKSLSAVMMQAALFWYQLQEHCEFLAKGEMKEMIEKALKYPEERRLKFWNSSGFKTKAVTYYAGWVALDHVCGIYMERIMLTQRELYTYIQEALRKEDAQKKVKELANSFLVDLESQQKAIAERKETQLKEMEELKEKGKKADEEAAAKKDAK